MFRAGSSFSIRASVSIGASASSDATESQANRHFAPFNPTGLTTMLHRATAHACPTAVWQHLGDGACETRSSVARAPARRFSAGPLRLVPIQKAPDIERVKKIGI